jgi:hypothetical protein
VKGTDAHSSRFESRHPAERIEIGSGRPIYILYPTPMHGHEERIFADMWFDPAADSEAAAL